jgi:hypothetical protein
MRRKRPSTKRRSNWSNRPMLAIGRPVGLSLERTLSAVLCRLRRAHCGHNDLGKASRKRPLSYRPKIEFGFFVLPKVVHGLKRAISAAA